MRSSRCMFNTATALHRVFVAPLEQSQFQLNTLRQRTAPLLTTTATTVSRPQSHVKQQCRAYANAYSPAPKPTTAEKSRFPRDDEIKAFSVTLVDENGRLTEARSTYSILESLDRRVNSLVVVVPGQPGVPPICKIMNKQQMRESEQAKLKASKGTGVTQKTMELNWAIGSNDLGHRMGKLRGWLEKGWKVEVVIAGKKKGRKATEEEAQALLVGIREVLEEVGGREMKPAEGKLLGQYTLYLEGKAKKEERKGEKIQEKPVAQMETAA